MSTTMTELIEKAPLILAGKGYELLIAPDAEMKKAELIEAATRITAVTSNNESADAQFHSRRLAQMRIAVEKCRKEVKEPVNRIGKLIDKAAKDFVEDIELEEKRIGRLIGDHATEVERLRQEKLREEARIFEEARRAREAAEVAIAEAQEARDNKVSIGEVVAARKAAEAAEEERQATLAARMEASAEVADTRVADGVRFAWDFEVDDMRLLAAVKPDFVEMTARRAVILSWIKALDAGEVEDVDAHCFAAGIRAFKKPVVSSR